jgi:prophage maintenance system killer protein
VIVFEITGKEDDPVYQALEIANGTRQYDFLRTIAWASLEMGRPFLSQHVIKALNFHAIVCLHTNAGEYRPCPVTVGVHEPPAHYRVPALMDDFVNLVNRNWDQDPVVLATYVLWRLNNIHPFINGNGRTARAACYFVLCLKAGGWLRGDTILPELIRQHHQEHCEALQEAHDSFAATGQPNLDRLHALLTRLLDEQLGPDVQPPEEVQAPIDPQNAIAASPDVAETAEQTLAEIFDDASNEPTATKRTTLLGLPIKGNV